MLGGHLHVQVGPTRVIGENGQAGYSYTTGTTGGAAYAIAIGSKPRREAEVTLVTYADGRPVGLQPVVLQTNGVFRVGRLRRARPHPLTTKSAAIDPRGGRDAAPRGGHFACQRLRGSQDSPRE